MKEKLNADFRQAMKDKDNLKRSVLRMVLASLKNAEIAKRTELSDGDILGLISKEVKQHEDSIQAFKEGNRPDLMEKEQAELAILMEYLPKQLSREEIISEAKQVIEEVGAQGPGDKGKVMPKIIARLKGQADGKEINEVVTELLSS
ncbi:MAG: GatB/YqeY domain-containing protein [Dehalococcoidales bacterium]|nr:MAG: GatB/YqeY domain-containing protein [Dehalococcoidales bacterium]